ncbi:MAG: TonB-dependent receptor [Pseudomonadota bacterium]
MKTQMNKIGAGLLMTVAGTLAVSVSDANAAEKKVICENAAECGQLGGAKGGPGTGVTDATVSLPIKLLEGTTLVNGQLTRDGHSIIPKVYISGHTGNLQQGQVFTIPVQGIEGGKRMQVQLDTVRDGDELIIVAPKGFGNAHVSGLGASSGDPRKILRVAAKVCDWGAYVEQPPVIVSPVEPITNVVAATPEPIADPVVIVTPPVVDPIVEAAPAAALMGAPRVVTSDAGAEVGIGGLALNYVTSEDKGWDGRAIVNASNGDSVVAVDTVYTNDSGKFQARLGGGAANIDGNTTDFMGRAQAFYSFIGNANTMANGDGWQLGVQGGIDPLAGAGNSVDNFMVNGATKPDSATLAVMQPALATNVLAAGVYAGWANDTFQVSGRVNYLDPSVNDRMGSSDKVAVTDEYYGAGSNRWTDGMHASVEAAFKGSNWVGKVGATYDRFNYGNLNAEVCGPCGFDFKLVNGKPQTNTTLFAGFDWSNDRWDLSANVNRTELKNVGGVEVTGMIVNDVYADLGNYSLKGVDAKGTYGNVEGAFAVDDKWTIVGGAAAGKWDMTDTGRQYDINGSSINGGVRYNFNDSSNGTFKGMFVEGRLGYEVQETVGDDFKKKDNGVTVGLQFGTRW